MVTGDGFDAIAVLTERSGIETVLGLLSSKTRRFDEALKIISKNRPEILGQMSVDKTSFRDT
jgi:hypothetical protein